jgi:hypothetical protein
MAKKLWVGLAVLAGLATSAAAWAAEAGACCRSGCCPFC